MSHPPPPSSQNGGAPAPDTVTASGRPGSPPRHHNPAPEAEDAALLLNHNNEQFYDSTALSVEVAEDAVVPSTVTTTVEHAEGEEDGADRNAKRARSETNSSQTTDEDRPASPPPPPATTRIAVAEDSSSSTDRHAGMMPKGVSYQALPGPDGPHPSATSTEWRSENAALKEAEFAVNMANRDVLEAQAILLVWKCKVFGWSFETERQTFFPQLAWIDLSVKANLEIMTNTIYRQSLSTVEADAHQKLADAEKKLEKAEAKLAKAKGELEKAKTEVSISELATLVLQSYGRLLRIAVLVDDVNVIGKAQGMRFLVNEIKMVLSKLSPDVITQMQNTIAFVLACSSGVGKTFFSLAAAQLLSDELKGKVGTLYLGFNSCMPLRANEETLLRQARSYESVERVLLRRLLIQLECLLAWKRKPSGPDPFTFDKYGLQHMVKMEGAFLASLPLLAEGAASLEAARKQALQLLTEVQKEYHLTHLMLVIDEGQKLDHLMPPSSMPEEQGGARCALRWTRQLQLDACLNKCGLLCFGLMTGIDPKTSLADQTDGTNHPLRHMPMELDEFQKLTKIALTKAIGKRLNMLDKTAASDTSTQPPTPSDEQVNLVAAYCYPEARVLGKIEVDNEYKFEKSSTENHFLFTGELPEDVRRRIVIGAVAGLPVDDTDWARTVPSTWAPDGRRTPCPSYAMLTGRLLKGIFSSGGDKLKIEDCFEFEKLAGETLRLLIWVCSEVSRTADDPYQKHGHEDVMNGIFLAQKDHSSFRSKVIKAFPATVKGYSSKYPKDAKSMHYPSSKQGTNTKAFAVGNDSPPLADTFKKYTDKLYDAKGGWACGEGNTLFFRCGGSAPMDFVILHKKSEKEWQLTLGDSKHTSNDSSTPVEDMAKRGDMVFRYLEHQLKTAKRTETQEYGVTLTWDRTVLLITNATRGAAVKEVEPPVRDDGTQPLPVTIVRLMPSTFTMGSVTEFLFALPSTMERNQCALGSPVSSK